MIKLSKRCMSQILPKSGQATTIRASCATGKFIEFLMKHFALASWCRDRASSASPTAMVTTGRSVTEAKRPLPSALTARVPIASST